MDPWIASHFGSSLLVRFGWRRLDVVRCTLYVVRRQARFKGREEN